MDVRTLINPAAQVTQVVTLSAGDTYKRLDKPSYGDEKIVFGQVIECMNNGETAAIVALEFTPASYGQVETKIKTFSGDTEMALFPCHLAEYVDALGKAIATQHDHVAGLHRQFKSAEDVLNRMQKALYNSTQAINAAATTAIND